MSALLIVLKILIRWFGGSFRLATEGTDVIFRLIVDVDYMLKAVDHVPVLAGGNGHAADGEIFVHLIKGG